MDQIYKKIKDCSNCKLCQNQSPLIQKCLQAEVFWVGLSAVRTQNADETPLSTNTNSGKLINSIENLFQSNSFYKTNIVKCLPLDNKDKIRYPSTKEMRECFFHLKKEIVFFKPKIVFLLGKQVAKFVLNEFGIKDFTLDNEFEYSTILIDNYIIVPIHHPSYILVYKRKKIQNYIRGIQNILKGIEKKNIIFEHKITKNINHNFSRTTYLTTRFYSSRNLNSRNPTKYTFIYHNYESKDQLTILS